MSSFDVFIRYEVDVPSLSPLAIGFLGNVQPRSQGSPFDALQPASRVRF